MKKYFLLGVGITTVFLMSGVLKANIDVDRDGSDHKKKKRYDYIIVGGGAAGCIEARKLSDDFNKSVLLLEAGGNFLNDPEVLDPNWVPHLPALFYNPKLSITYPTYSGALHVYSEGHSLGGGATHNNMIAVRGTPDIYDGWATVSSNPRWSYYGNIVNLMKNLETYTPNGTVANPAERGFSGPIALTQNPPILPGAYPFLDQLSVYTAAPFEDDYNNPPLGNICISAVQQLNTPVSRSWSAKEFLAPVIDANGHGIGGRKLTVIWNAQALDFRINDEMRATSVHYIAQNNERNENEFEVTKASLTKNTGILILAAGSVQTPKLLLQSGVGPAAQLASVGIPLVLDSPHVGQNLQCHYGSSATVTGGTVPFEASSYLDGYPFMANDGIRRLQFISSPAGANFRVSTVLIRPQSRGSVTVISNNPMIEPLVDVAVFTDGSVATPGTDAYMQVSAFKMIQAAATAAGQTVVSPTPAQYASDATLLAAASSSITLQAHIVGTARMGTDISNGVVDGNLKMFGLDNVYIGDNSIQPQTNDGNTCCPAYYIALVLCQVLGVPTPPIL
jgi:choline dehydrogenase